ncbi:phosphotransferase [Brachybacterium timonense]|uniref:phosphotransferase n=1 Tax=Brachybacterium timonense TaxID=2050896 RepID=UPI001482B3B5|nr:phosphotransferase [Brachybacterium timonense]
MSRRLSWDDLPHALRASIEEGVLGAPVIDVRSCSGGFSRSTAEIVRSTKGQELFVKAIRELENPETARLNRIEAATLSRLPSAVPAPRLLTVLTHDDWIVLVTEVAPGCMPETPWTSRQLETVLTALDSLQQAVTPCPLGDVPTLVATLGPDMLGFERVTEDPPEGLDPWIQSRLPRLCLSARAGIAALEGDTLCHSDLRSDNILITERGVVTLVDWAWACRGSRVADALQLLSSVEDPCGTLDVSGLVDGVLARHDIAPTVGTDVLVGILGFFVDAARKPVDPGLPTLQAHRRRARDSLLTLVQSRWDREEGASLRPT